MAGRVFGVLLLWWAQAVCAQPVQTVAAQLPPPTAGDGAAGDNFGVALAVDGELAAIGVVGDTVVAAGATFGIAQGSVSLYQRVGSDWLARGKLTPDPAGDDGDNFGAAVALEAGVLAVGAPRRRSGETPEVGSVHVYTVTGAGATLSQVLQPTVAVTDLRFGGAVALWQDWLAVGVLRADAGRVDLYRRDGDGRYQYQQSLLPAPGIGPARFGSALALADGELLVGAPFADDAGAVYRSSLVGAQWSPPARLPLVAAAQSQLGAALVQDDGLALVGAPGSGAGAVRVLGLAGGAWSQLASLTPAGLSGGDRFGSALALDGQRAAIAADAALAFEGRVLVYARSGDGLTEVQRIDRVDGGDGDRFGASVALVADGLLAGADLDQVGPNRGQGAVYWLRDAGDALEYAGRLDNGDGAMFDRYGTAVAIDRDIALIGAYVEDTLAGADAGAAHWYRRVEGGWQYGGRIDAPDADIEDRFGIAVDVDGTRMAIGAYWDVVDGNVDQGSVYVYRREADAWVLEQKLSDASGNEADYFGFALSLDGDTLAVGARGDSDFGLEQGAVHIFRRGANGWQPQARLDLTPGNGFAYFGASLALSGDRLVVGAPGATLSGGIANTGAAFLFGRESGAWFALATLKSTLPQADSAFGFSVAANANWCLVGAFLDGDTATGAAYVYSTLDGGFDARLRAPSPQIGEGLAIAVALSGDSALLGASGHDRDGRSGIGRVLQFDRGAAGWQASGEWRAADGRAGDGFGRALGMDAAGGFIVGAPGKGVQNPLEGMAYAGSLERVFRDGFE